MTHVVLLGDSVFDNAAYVPGGPDVIRQVRERLPAGWRATLRAVDGATTAGVPGQAQRLPPDATHLIVSVGGNDALGHIGVLEEAASSLAQALDRLAAVGTGFAHNYRTMLDGVLARGLPTAICTIYGRAFPIRACNGSRSRRSTCSTIQSCAKPPAAACRSLTCA